mgnify:CR=1 FL=1
MPISGLMSFTPAATRTHGLPMITAGPEDVMMWAITRSYFAQNQHLQDAERDTLARRLGCARQTARKWLRQGWSKTMLSMVDRQDVLDELASGRSYRSIADELAVDDLALRQWCREQPDALRRAEEYRVETLMDRAKRDVLDSGSSESPGAAKAAAAMLTHAQWCAERLYSTKFKPTGGAPTAMLSLNFQLGPAAPPAQPVIEGQVIR